MERGLLLPSYLVQSITDCCIFELVPQLEMFHDSNQVEKEYKLRKIREARYERYVGTKHMT